MAGKKKALAKQKSTNWGGARAGSGRSRGRRASLPPITDALVKKWAAASAVELFTECGAYPPMVYLGYAAHEAFLKGHLQEAAVIAGGALRYTTPPLAPMDPKSGESIGPLTVNLYSADARGDDPADRSRLINALPVSMRSEEMVPHRPTSPTRIEAKESAPTDGPVTDTADPDFVK
jgi:hypothetical protein